MAKKSERRQCYLSFQVKGIVSLVVWKDNRSSQSHCSCSLTRKERVMNHDIELTLCTIQDTSCDTMVGFEDGMKSLRGKRNERIND